MNQPHSKKQYIENILGSKAHVRDDHIKYYYTQHPNLCCDFPGLKPFLEDIEPYAYYKLATEIGKLYKGVDHNKFILEFMKGVKNLKLNKNNYQKMLEVKEDDPYINYLMLYYVQCRPEVKVLTVWPKSAVTVANVEKKLEGRKVYAHKKLTLTGKSSQGLIFQMYGYTKEYKKIIDLKNLSLNLGWDDETKKKDIHVFVYEGDELQLENSHTSGSFMQAMNLAKIYFNKNSLQLLERQALDRMMSFNFRKCRILLNTFINFIFRNIYTFDLDKFLVLSGSVLFTHGIRACSDVDFFIGNNPKVIATPKFTEIVEDNLLNEDTKFFFMDGFTKLVGDGKYWRDFWEQWHVEWAKLFGAEHVSETIFNPKYHYYFMGIKMMYLDADLVRRNIRGRPAAVADLIMANRLLGLGIEIKPIPKETIKDDKVTKTTPGKFLKTVRNWLKRRYHVNMSIDELKTIVKFD
jgi:hypothetical protein